MLYLAGLIMGHGSVRWQHLGQLGAGRPDGLTVSFPLSDRISPREANNIIEQAIKHEKICWLKPAKKFDWVFLSDKFKEFFDEYRNCDWLKGALVISMDCEHRTELVFDAPRVRTICQFVISPETVQMQMPKKIFLSHKGVDKRMVRKFNDSLELLGFAPWLDEAAMPAGVSLERELLKGLKDSCAAVFFVTPDYVDTGYLQTEVDYAVAEKRLKGDRFAIVSLVFRDAEGNSGKVPQLLRPYVWKTPESELDALNEIIRALPLSPGEPNWR